MKRSEKKKQNNNGNCLTHFDKSAFHIYTLSSLLYWLQFGKTFIRPTPLFRLYINCQELSQSTQQQNRKFRRNVRVLKILYLLSCIMHKLECTCEIYDSIQNKYHKWTISHECNAIYLLLIKEENKNAYLNC